MSLTRQLKSAKAELQTVQGDDHDVLSTHTLHVSSFLAYTVCLCVFAGGLRQSIEDQQNENQRLRAQVAEMESFLNDYGLVWVGSEKEAPAASNSAHPSGSVEEAPAGGVSPGGRDNAAVVGRLQELNALAGDGKKRVSNVGGAAKLVDGERLKIALYGNGFMLRRGPFRTYDLESSQAFFKDVLDGYFPFELKEAFPRGVAFDVLNTPEKQYTGPGVNSAGDLVTITGSSAQAGDRKHSAPPVHMPGEGRKLVADDEVGASGLAKHGGGLISLGGGGADAPGQGRFAEQLSGKAAQGSGSGGSMGGQGGGKLHTLLSAKQAGGALDTTLSRDALLEKMPSSVVRNGKVIAVREGLASMLRGAHASDRPDIVVVQTPVALAIAAGEEGGEGGVSPSTVPHDVTTLQVKSDSGRQTLLLKFHFGDCIGDVYDYVNMHRTRGTPFVLRTSFPAASYTDRSMTLQEAGLVPNAVLRITPQGGAAASEGGKK